MSQIYQNLPPTNGKVVLNTTCGDIDVELWSKEAPMACRNFIQLCMEVSSPPASWAGAIHVAGRPPAFPRWRRFSAQRGRGGGEQPGRFSAGPTRLCASIAPNLNYRLVYNVSAPGEPNEPLVRAGSA